MVSDAMQKAYFQGIEDGEVDLERELLFALRHPEVRDLVVGHLVVCHPDCPHEDHEAN